VYVFLVIKWFVSWKNPEFVQLVKQVIIIKKHRHRCVQKMGFY